MRRRLAKFLLRLSDWLDAGRKEQARALLERVAQLRAAAYLKAETFRASAAPDWTQDDTANFRTFISTASGQALILRLNAMVATVAIAGCNDPMHTTHSAGIGAGWDEAIKKLIEHSKFSRVAGDQVTTNELPPGEEELLARFSP
jgi:hypothetical protein